MTDFSNFLLVSDYDHTLTDHAGHIPQSNLDAIAYFIAHGGTFTICTGRSLPASRRLFRNIPTNAPLLFCNGAGCYDLNRDALIFCHPLPEDCQPLIERCVDTFTDIRLEIHTLQTHYVFNGDAERDAALIRQGAQFRYPHSWEEIERPWVKFSMYNRTNKYAAVDPDSERSQYFQKVRDTVAQWAGDGYVVTRSMPCLIEVQIAGTSKGLSSRELAQKLGGKTLVCAGDAPNDLSMLEEADLPFYVSDGDSRMVQYGFPQCAPSYEGAIADIIRKLEEE